MKLSLMNDYGFLIWFYFPTEEERRKEERHVVGTESGDSKGQSWVEWKAVRKYRKRERK